VDAVHTDGHASATDQGADLPEIGEGGEEVRSALAVLSRVPYGTVTALILRRSVAGAGAGAEPRPARLAADLRPDTATRKTMPDASAAVDANTTIIDAGATVALKEAVALSVLLGPHPNAISTAHRQRAKTMVTRHGAGLRRLGLSADAHRVGEGTDDEAISAAYRLHNTLMRGEMGGGHVALWQTYAVRYEDAHATTSRTWRRRGRSGSLGAIMRAWVAARLNSVGWAGMWRMAVVCAMRAAATFMAEGRMGREDALGRAEQALRATATRTAMSDRHHAHTFAHHLLDAMGMEGDRERDIASGLADALIDAHTFYASDWVAPAALQERLARYRNTNAPAPDGAAAQAAAEHDIVAPAGWADVTFETAATIGDAPVLAAQDVDPDAWAAFCEAQGYAAELVPPGSNEDIDGEFRSYVAPAQLAHADTDA